MSFAKYTGYTGDHHATRKANRKTYWDYGRALLLDMEIVEAIKSRIWTDEKVK